MWGQGRKGMMDDEICWSWVYCSLAQRYFFFPISFKAKWILEITKSFRCFCRRWVELLINTIQSNSKWKLLTNLDKAVCFTKPLCSENNSSNHLFGFTLGFFLDYSTAGAAEYLFPLLSQNLGNFYWNSSVNRPQIWGRTVHQCIKSLLATLGGNQFALKDSPHIGKTSPEATPQAVLNYPRDP